MIDKNSILRRTKRKILKNEKQEIWFYVKLPYPQLKKKKKTEKEDGQLKRFIEMFTNLQVNIPFSDALE